MPRADPRIAFVVPRYGARVVGGAETLCRLMAENLRAHGVPVEVLTTCALDHFTWRNELPAGRRTEGGVPVHRFPVSEARDPDRFWGLHAAIAQRHPLSHLEQVEWMGHSVWAPGLQAALEDAGTYDWVLALPYLFGTTFWAVDGRPDRTALIPCVHDEPHAWLPVVRRMLGAARGALLNSEGEHELFGRLAPGAPGVVVGVGYDDEPAPDADAVTRFCAARGIAPGYLLYAGRREEAKGLPLLFDGYRELLRERPAAPRLALMGSGDLLPPDDLAARVIDLGYVPDADRAAAYAAASVLVNPSRLESLGMVVLEAWRAGTPALVNGGSPVLRSHCARSGGGLWFHDAGGLAEAAALMLDDPGLAGRMAVDGDAYVRSEFSWPEVRRRLLGALAEWS